MKDSELCLTPATAYCGSIPRIRDAPKSSSLYWPDGSLVLLSEQAAYCIHKSLLACHCQFFDTLPVLDNSLFKKDRSQEFVGRIPVLPLHDEPQCLDMFLNMLLNPA